MQWIHAHHSSRTGSWCTFNRSWIWFTLCWLSVAFSPTPLHSALMDSITFIFIDLIYFVSLNWSVQLLFQDNFFSVSLYSDESENSELLLRTWFDFIGIGIGIWWTAVTSVGLIKEFRVSHSWTWRPPGLAYLRKLFENKLNAGLTPNCRVAHTGVNYYLCCVVIQTRKWYSAVGFYFEFLSRCANVVFFYCLTK